MPDVKSFRISDESQERVKEIAKNQPSMEEAFKAILNAYDESQALASSQNTAFLLNMKALCDNVYSAFRTVLESQAVVVAQVKEQDLAEIEKLRNEIEIKGHELQQAHERVQATETALINLQAENSTLKELNMALKGQNDVLEQNNQLLKDKVDTLSKKPARKSVPKQKQETSTIEK